MQILRYLTQTENSHQESQMWPVVKRGYSVAGQCLSSCGKSLQRSDAALLMVSSPSPPPTAPTYRPAISMCSGY